MGMTLACDISIPLGNLLWHTQMTVGAKCSWNLTLRYSRINSPFQVKFKTIDQNVCAPSQLQIKGLDQSLQKVCHYIICNGMAQLLPSFETIARNTFIETQSSYLMFMTFPLCIVFHETTEGWNTPKYNLNRWLLHNDHHWARFIPTIWFVQQGSLFVLKTLFLVDPILSEVNF